MRLMCLSDLVKMGDEPQAIRDSIALLDEISTMGGRAGDMTRRSALSSFSMARKKGFFRSIEECTAWLKELEAKK